MNSKTKGSLVTVLTWALVLVFFFPVFWMFLNGFKPESAASSTTPKLFFSPTLDGFQRRVRPRDAGLPHQLGHRVGHRDDHRGRPGHPGGLRPLDPPR